MTTASDEPSTSTLAHDIANDAGEDGYFDPDTGLFVMTQGFLLRRGTCCTSNCRHCPYDADVFPANA